jgi:hypothetical protein
MLGKIADSSFITFLLLIRLHEAPSVARATGKSLLNEDAIAAYEALIDSTLAGGRA